MTTERIAALDFGTNTARLLIAERTADGSFSHVRIEREIVRMGGGFCRENGLSPEAVERGLACLERFSDVLKDNPVAEIRGVATSAVRDAANGSWFLEEARRRTGITLRVIDGTREGALTLAGVIAGLDCEPENLLVFDVGGGSTEYTLARNGSAVFIKSLPLGVVRLTEGKGTVAAMGGKIDKELALLLEDLRNAGQMVDPRHSLLVGTAGTATTLAAIKLKMENYDYRLVNNSLLTIEEIKDIFERLLPMRPEDRVQVPGLEKGREDLIIAGTLLTVHTMERFGFSEMKVSDYGLLEGLIVADDF